MVAQHQECGVAHVGKTVFHPRIADIGRTIIWILVGADVFDGKGIGARCAEDELIPLPDCGVIKQFIVEFWVPVFLSKKEAEAVLR